MITFNSLKNDQGGANGLPSIKGECLSHSVTVNLRMLFLVGIVSHLIIGNETGEFVITKKIRGLFRPGTNALFLLLTPPLSSYETVINHRLLFCSMFASSLNGAWDVWPTLY